MASRNSVPSTIFINLYVCVLGIRLEQEGLG